MKIRGKILFLCLAASSAWAYVEDHFKAAGEKQDVVSISGIDFIYLLNLDERPEKYRICLERLEPYGIRPHRFSAVNGWKLPLEVIQDLGVTLEPWMQSGIWGTYYPIEEGMHGVDEIVQTIGRNYFSHQMSRGAIGCVLSHLSILQDAYDARYRTIWIMEDDVVMVRDPHILSDLIAELDTAVSEKGWDILFTDTDTIATSGNRVSCAAYAWRPNFTPVDPHRFAKKESITPNLRYIGSRYGSYSMILRRSGIEKILNFFKRYQIFLPYDMEYTQPDGIRLFTVLDDVVSTQANAITDNGAPNYEKN